MRSGLSGFIEHPNFSNNFNWAIKPLLGDTHGLFVVTNSTAW